MFNPNPPHTVRTPFMFQSWKNISFLHWQYDAHVLQSRLPGELTLDQFEGSGWISLTPFFLENLRLPFLPALPWISRFPEMNLRTYVNGPCGPGIWFFALDADRLAAVIGARSALGLPYFWSDMQVTREGDRMHYYSSRGGRAVARIEIQVGEALENPDELATFLVARFRLYALHRGQLLSVAVEHKRWPLHHARVVRLQESVTDTHGFRVHNQQPVVHFSPGVDVRVGPARKQT